MKTFYFFSLFLILTACSSNSNNHLDNLTDIKKDFINSIFKSCTDEGPFRMNYHLRTILFSDNIVSLLGEIFVYDHLPHGWSQLESKTYIRADGKYKEITLKDLFPLASQKEFLRSYCEDFLKRKCDHCSYFNGEEPLRDYLDSADINLFVVDHESLIILFQTYTVGGLGDGPFAIKIPFTELIGKWQAGNPLEKQLPITKNFISSWDENSWVSEVSEDHSIANQTAF